MAKILSSSSVHWQHPLSQRSAAFRTNRNHARPRAVIQAAGQPKPTKRIAQLAGILITILLPSLCVVLGLFPELYGEQQTSTTHGARHSNTVTLPAALADMPLNAQLAVLDSGTDALLKAEQLNVLGVGYLSKNQSESAIKCFDRAIAADSNFVAAHNNLGSAFLHSGQNPQARNAFLCTLQLQPANAYAAAQLAKLNASDTALAKNSQTDSQIVPQRDPQMNSQITARPSAHSTFR